MKSKMKLLAALAVLSCSFGGMAISADQADADAPSAGGAASKVELRSKDYGVNVAEMRVVRRNDILVVQADFKNSDTRNRVVFYRFRWLDSTGSQVGDNDAFRQIKFLGKQQQTLKGVAPHARVTDFRIEMNVERK